MAGQQADAGPLRDRDVRIGFVGFGNMASAMADGFIRSGCVDPRRLYACAGRYERLKARTDARGMNACHDAAEVLSKSDVVVVALTPNMIERVLVPLAAELEKKVVISIAAGWDFEAYERIVPGAHHLSTIPNTPVSICEGVVVAERRHSLTDEEHELALWLLGLLGMVEEVESCHLSVGGTVAGCSPAFVAMVMEALADAAVKHGIPRPTAQRLVSQMAAGTAKLQLETGDAPGVMKDAVCSPGGTTIRGVAALEECGVRAALIRAVDAAEGL